MGQIIEINTVNSKFQSEQESRKKYEQESQALRLDITDLSKANGELRKEAEMLKSDESRLKNFFSSLGQEALSNNSKLFVEQLKGHLDSLTQKNVTHLETHKSSIDSLVKPLKDQLERLERQTQEFEAARNEQYGKLSGQVDQVMNLGMFLSDETRQLRKALTQPVARGMLGQKLLTQVLQYAGLEENVHFRQQLSFRVDGETLRPDAIVYLSDGKELPIDAKFPLDSYQDVVNAATDEERQERLDKLVSNLRNYAKDLQSKQYWLISKNTPGIVIMFVPGEFILNDAMQHDEKLWNECVQRRVMLASPTTLIAMLYTIAYGWRQKSFEKNAQEIQKNAAELYDRLATFTEHFTGLGAALRRSYESYNDAVGSLDRNVFPKAREMKELGLQTKKEIPDLRLAETTVRKLNAPEVQSSQASLGIENL